MQPIRISNHARRRMISRGTTEAETRQLTEEIIADYSPDGRLTGLEILEAHRVLQQTAGRLVFGACIDDEFPKPIRQE